MVFRYKIKLIMKLKKNLKPIHKFNGGIGATLCHNCSVIINTGLTDDLYCDECIKDYLKSEEFAKDFSDAVTRDTWEKGLPKIYIDNEGYIVEHFSDGTIIKKKKVK